jgi:hypothetical protein
LTPSTQLLHDRVVRTGVVLVIVAACGEVTPGQQHDAPIIDAPLAIDAPVDAGKTEHLYVCNDTATGGIAVYALPLTQSSAIAFTIAEPSAFDAAFDATGDLVADAQGGSISIFSQPVSGTSTPDIKFQNGAATPGGQLAVTPTGTLIASFQGASLNVFSPPLTNASTPATTISSASVPNMTGIALDAAANLYVSSNAGFLGMFPPPYATATVVTPAVTGASYRKLTASATQLFVASVAPAPGRIDVYTLPLTAASQPAFSITTGINAPESVALDAGGHLYSGNINDMTVTRFSPPFSAASVPDVTVKVATSAFSIFGIGIGP